MKNSRIEWTHHTVNFWWGCTKVSPACQHCYAEGIARRFGPGVDAPPVKWGVGQPRSERLTAAGCEVMDLNASAAKRGVRELVFVNSMSDWLDAEVPVWWLGFLLGWIKQAQWLDFQLLTKRPQLWRVRLQAVHDEIATTNPALAEWLSTWLDGTPPPNVWIGWTAENQEEANGRTAKGLMIPAACHFVSVEPMLAPVNLRAVEVGYNSGIPSVPAEHNFVDALRVGIDWVICGGESGHGSRPMHPDWAKSLRDQCAGAGVPFFFKQWGAWAPGCPSDSKTEVRAVSPGVLMGRFGKANTGRKLQGVEHNAFPEVRS